MSKFQIAVNTDYAKDIATTVSRHLADTYCLYLKTQYVHWNITGPLFYAIHLLTEKQYQEMAQTIDELAERLRALGHVAPASFAKFLKLTHFKEMQDGLSAEQMVSQLHEDHIQATQRLREIISVTTDHGDDTTTNLLADCLAKHEKNAWLLRSTMGK